MDWTLWLCEASKQHVYSAVAPSFPSSDVLDEEDGAASCQAGIVGFRGGPIVGGRAGDPGIWVPSALFEPPRDVSKRVFTDLSSCWSSAYEIACASLTLSNIYRGCQ
jgi:hypothetical protein